ncbi:hypothetical protein Dsin_019992 [Dipteronia sinensis]|uniref:Alpha-galactosidase n=1 Tax=Dipteronia sinensis TaxID=43782 RepID=A0AAE0E3K7_9ROSI|nr:hypothetical protein Dsin_019992 [Dipteronia sinensis]
MAVSSLSLKCVSISTTLSNKSFEKEPTTSDGHGFSKSFNGIFNTSNYGILQLNNSLARTPQMGSANALISTGLADLGYVYVNIDDCWYFVTRVSEVQLVPDPKTFPSGIKALFDYIHGKGLKLGI